jgi:hypothetical protein
MEAFRECGVPAFVILLIAVVGVLLGLIAFSVAFFKPKAGLIIGSIAFLLAFATPIVGVVGTAMGRAKVEQALRGGAVDPAFKERIRQQGNLEASQCTSLGAYGCALPLLLSVGAMLFSFVRRQTETPVNEEQE